MVVVGGRGSLLQEVVGICLTDDPLTHASPVFTTGSARLDKINVVNRPPNRYRYST